MLDSDDGRAERWIRIGGWQGTPKLAALFSPASKNAAANDFRTGRGLADRCYFTGEITMIKQRFLKIDVIGHIEV